MKKEIKKEETINWCYRCKKENKKVIVQEINNSCEHYLIVRCSKCKKTIYVIEIPEKEKMKIKRVYDDLTCCFCGKKTNIYDLYSIISYLNSKNDKYICCEECFNKRDIDIE